MSETKEKPASETKEEKPAKHKLFGMMAAVVPDKPLESDDDVMDAAHDHIQDLQDFKGKAQEHSKKINDLMDGNPELASTVQDMMGGKSFRSSLAKHYGPEHLIPSEGDEDHADFVSNTAARKKGIDDRQKLEDEITANAGSSIDAIKQFGETKGLSDEEAQAFLAKIDSNLEDIFKGKVTPEFLQTMYDGLNYEGDLKTAREQGEVSGQNKKIKIVKDKMDGDKLPVIPSANTVEPDMPAQKPSWMEKKLADRKAKGL